MKNDFTVIYGGSFNPFHLGHLAMIDGGLHELSPKQLIVIPNALSPLKEEHAISQSHRLGMLKAALSSHPSIEINALELKRGGPSYAVDTLRALKKNIHHPLVFLMGSDSFASLNQWHQAEHLHELCHFAVVRRLGVLELDPNPVYESLGLTQTQNLSALSATDAGLVYHCSFQPPQISATEIRETFLTDSLPDEVNAYLKKHDLELESLLSSE